MPPQPRPWFRRQTQTWYVQLNGRKVNLGKDKKAAHDKFYAMMQAGGAHRVTARTLLRLYGEWVVGHCAPTTVDRRKPIIVSFGNFLAPRLWADDVRPYHVQQWLKTQPRVKSPTTVNTRITLIKAIWNWGETMGYVARNPIARMPKPRPRVRQEYIPPDLWRKALDLATDQEFRDYLTMMLLTGMRPQELHALEARHIQGKEAVFDIGDSKGRRRSRVVYLPNEAIAILARLVKERPTGKLLVNSKGKPWTRNSVRCRFRYLKRELGMPGLCATTLRHSFAHCRLTQGQDALTVAKLMGHVDTRMLATRYGHIDANQEYMRNAANNFGRLA